MAVVLLGLGPFRFSITDLSFQQLSRTFEYRWEAQPRIGRRPAHQFLGAGVEQINLQGTIFTHYHSGLGQIERMRSDAQRGVPYALASGYGMHYGTFCIKSIADEQTIFHKSGAPLKVNFQIGLVAYGADQTGFGIGLGGLAFGALGLAAQTLTGGLSLGALAGAAGLNLSALAAAGLNLEALVGAGGANLQAICEAAGHTFESLAEIGLDLGSLVGTAAELLDGVDLDEVVDAVSPISGALSDALGRGGLDIGDIF